MIKWRQEEAAWNWSLRQPIEVFSLFPCNSVLHSYLRNPFSTYTRILSIIITSLAREIVEMLCQTRLIVVRRSHLVHTSFPFFFSFRSMEEQTSLLANIPSLSRLRRYVFFDEYFLGEGSREKRNKKPNARFIR